MKELGEYLKETREKNCVGLDEASEDLKISKIMLQNIEKGNSRAFKDMLELKDKVKQYAKYLGLDPDKVVDEFNDFLFEHTSRIKLEDILDAEKAQKEEKKKVVSPYTIIKRQKKHINTNNIKIAIIILLCLAIFIIGFRKITAPKDKNIGRELMPINYSLERMESI